MDRIWLVTSITMLLSFGSTNPNWNLKPIPTTYRYENGDTVFVAEGRFIDSLYNIETRDLEQRNFKNNVPITNTGIFIYKVFIDDSNIIR